MTRERTARELEGAAALRDPPARRALAGAAAGAGSRTSPLSEPLAMLLRRGLHPRPIAPDLPFPPAFEAAEPARAEAFAGRLSHYAFRLFLRGAILAGGPFRP